MATYRQRGKKTQVQVRMLGVTESATFPSKTMAKEWGRKREAEIIAGAHGLVVTGHTVAEMLQKYIDDVTPTKAGGRWEALRLALIRRQWKSIGQPVDRVSSADVAALRDQRLLSVKPPSVRRELGLLSAVFELAKTEWKWCATNPVKDVAKPPRGKPRKRLVRLREYKAILRKARYRPGQVPVLTFQWAIAAWCLALRTGMRAGELIALERANVDLKRCTAELIDTKNGTDREIPLFPRALRVLRALPASPDPEQARVFWPLSSGNLDALFRKLRDGAGVKGLTFHDSRHTAVTMFAEFLPVLELARVIGHSDLNSLLVYYNTTAAEIAGRKR